jgi:acyl carrier protein
MNNPYQEQQILDIVRRALAEVMGHDLDKISADAALVNDLDADSLDFVEFRYMVERELGIVLPQKSVLDHLVAAIGEDRVYHKGQITESAADVLRNSFFRYGEDQAAAGMRPSEIMAATTARNWAAYCHALFDHLPAACPDCGFGEAQLSPAGKVVCGDCGVPQKPKTGDEAVAIDLPRILGALTSLQDSI